MIALETSIVVWNGLTDAGERCTGSR
jgi:hypothetical protein